ncbi:MAG: glycosyltransferase family 4 protein [Lacipirellulaceae bacterium]
MTRQRQTVLLASTNCLGGVTTWASMLRDGMLGHERYDVKLLYIGKRRGQGHDLRVRNTAAAIELVKSLAPVIVAPNYVWDLYMAGLEPGVTCLGMCHSDSESEYYHPLTWYEPVVSHFVAVSNQIEEQLTTRMAFRAGDVTTLPYGVAVPGSIAPRSQRGPLRIVYAGRLIQFQKRVRDFVPLVSNLLRSNTDFTFDIYGDGPESDEVRGAVAKLAPGHRVRFHGFVPHSQMSQVWASHDVFVQTSEFEGTSVSMLEAMAHGVTPVVTAARSGIDGVIEHGVNGFVAPIGDMNQLAASIQRLAADRKLLQSTSAKAHATGQNYSHTEYVQKFGDVLDRVSASRGPIDVERRYGRYAPSHPLMLQRQALDRLQKKVALLEGGVFGKLAALWPDRPFRRTGRKAA